MIVLFWNIRGIGNDSAQTMLFELQKTYKPDIIAITEPKILLSDLWPRFWSVIIMQFLAENVRGGGLRPNILVAYSRVLPVALTVFLLRIRI